MLQDKIRTISVPRGHHKRTPPNTATGLCKTACIASPTGWRKVTQLQVGDQVQTLYNGPQPIKKVSRSIIPSQAHLNKPKTWPLFIPAETIGNTHELILAPDQPILIESPHFKDLCESRRAVIKASILFGHLRIHRVIPSDCLELVQLHFADEQVVYGKEGVLYLCATDPHNMFDRRSATDPVHYKSFTPKDSQKVIEALPTVCAAMLPQAATSIINADIDSVEQGMWII